MSQMETVCFKKKLLVSITTALAGLFLLCFLMGNAVSVYASETESSDDTVVSDGSYGADVLIPVERIAQNPELPNGCEVTALTMMLQQKGFGIDKVALSNFYLPKELFQKVEVAGQKEPLLYCGDPEKVYAGDPASKDDGFYSFQGPIIQAANQYLEEQGSPLIALDMSGAPESGLVGLLDQGTPVMVWCTLKMDSLRFSTKKSWIISETGETYVPYSNVHAMVLVGYDSENFYLNDPLNGLVTCSRSSFMNIFAQLGSRAVVLL